MAMWIPGVVNTYCHPLLPRDVSSSGYLSSFVLLPSISIFILSQLNEGCCTLVGFENILFVMKLCSVSFFLNFGSGFVCVFVCINPTLRLGLFLSGSNLLNFL